MTLENKLTYILCAVSVISTMYHIYNNEMLLQANIKLKQKIQELLITQNGNNMNFKLPEPEPEPVKKENKKTKLPPGKSQITRMARDKGYQCLQEFYNDVISNKDTGKTNDGKKITKLMVQRCILAEKEGWVDKQN